MINSVKIIGAGLAGCEAAYFLAGKGINTELYEMKPVKYTPAHKSNNFAELVCSNSLKAERIETAAGLLKHEIKELGSLCIEAAYKAKVPAGGALAVDRELFSSYITEKIKNNKFIKIINKEVKKIPLNSLCIIASGPLTSQELSDDIEKLLGEGCLSFYDAAAPIISKESIDFDHAFYASRYDRGGEDDYINCPLNKEKYELFVEELKNGQTAPLHKFDKNLTVYEGCMPVEVMAKRGTDTLRFGPFKPVGLIDPKTDKRPYAVLQLRKETALGEMFNLVGCQTNLKFYEQERIFGIIPALKDAVYHRYGVMHRNTFINSPLSLNYNQSAKTDENIFFAGQITGVEGYMESAASGILAGIQVFNKLNSKPELVLPKETMLGALSHYIIDNSVKNFQPMGANFGIMPPLLENIKNKKERYKAYALRSQDKLKEILFETEV